MTYKIYTDDILTHQTDHYRQALLTVLETDMSEGHEVSMYFNNIMLFKITNSINDMGMIRDFLRSVCEEVAYEKV